MEKERRILKNRVFLYLTEFFAGMSLMAVELGANRLLAPYFSSSQIVWTIIIGTIMIAMALGNVYGGRKVDRDPDPDKLYGRIMIAAIWIACIPVLGKYVIAGISAVVIFSVNSMFLIWAGLITCLVIFVFPLFLLGTVTPSLVKFTVSSTDESGRTVGILNASNTIGSIIGTFLPTFVTIPTVGTSLTFLIFSGILLLLCVIYFLSAGIRHLKVIIGVAAFVICCFFGSSDSFAFWEKDLIYETESVYNYLQVKEIDHGVTLSTNVLFGIQSINKKDDSLTGLYYDYAMAAPYMADVKNRENLDVLILGMGTGTYATQCRRYFDNLTIEGVEIDKEITELAYRYFELSKDIKVTTYDGRAYLNAVDKTYDVIMVDAYQDITIPFQMSSIEFFNLVRKHLKEDGVMVVNMNMRGEEEGNINQYLADTISHAFSQVYTADVDGSTNRELFASDNPDMLTWFDDNAAVEKDQELSAIMTKVRNKLTRYEAGPYLMTDDRAPVELLGMRVIDSLISDEVTYYKKIYEKDGFSGLLEALK